MAARAARGQRNTRGQLAIDPLVELWGQGPEDASHLWVLDDDQVVWRVALTPLVVPEAQ